MTSTTSSTRSAAGHERSTLHHRATRNLPDAPVPASGAWRDGDPAGERKFADVGTFDLEAGGRLPDVRVAYETHGELAPDRSNAVLVLHALTGDAHVRGPAGPGQLTAGWWEPMIGPGAPIDTDRYFVVVPNVLGGCQGTTGPSSTAPDGRPWGGRFPRITTRDQVAVEVELSRLLGIRSWASVVGASMGGMRVLEWSVLGPESGIEVRSIAAIATAAQSSGDQIAWAHPQLGAIRADPRWNGGDYYDAPDGEGPHAGLAIARQIAHTTYRTARELDERFGRLPQGGEDPFDDGRFAVQSYLDHHGDKLARRFDANSYLRLTETMMTHDLGRDRGGVGSALAQITARALVVAVDSDRLFPPAQAERIAAGLPHAEPLRIVTSDFGHDGFLIEHDQTGPLLRDFLGQVAPVPPA
ncbi:homoserine O-acetyltransferase [Isoptericola halotolerans]|uniref:Homoserine O-acetyltransferase n=1 Tax=Isoptericola halotolerans TaxID=300560 RepID=A0ABX2A3A1_9MICO|nr:homoserine O-acetyltransferase [Isoptericola halotolerans]NOV97215.1 homoserine O-acetyltransferase [Isoptericola halotolerans]